MDGMLYMPRVHAGREVIYASLSRIFLEVPSEKLFTMLADLLPSLEQFGEGTDDVLLADGVKGLRRFVAACQNVSPESKEGFMLNANRNFTRLFCLTDSVATSESVYTSPEHLTMQEATGEVSRQYAGFGFAMASESNEPADHLSYELMFISSLAKATAKALENGDAKTVEKTIAAQRDFLTNHLLYWTGKFVKTMVKFPQSVDLYAPVAYFMLGYIKADQSFLKGEN